MPKKTKGTCAFCGKPIYLSHHDEHHHEDRWRHHVGADGKQAGHIAKPKQNERIVNINDGGLRPPSLL